MFDLKNNKLALFINVCVGFFFLSALTFQGGYNVAPMALMLLGLGYSVYCLFKKMPFALTKEAKWLIWTLLFYFSVFVLSWLIHDGKIRELDNPSRVLLFIPVLLLLLHIPPRLNMVLYAIPLGSIIAGITAIYDKLVLHSEMAFSSRIMHIQGGDISMSLGMFSFAIGFYFFQKTQLKLTALCILAALFGILGSILSTARGGWPALPILLIALLWIYRRNLSKTFFITLIGLFTLAIIGITQMPNNQISERFAAAQDDIQQYLEQGNGSTSVGARFDMWQSVFIMVQEKPILGWGTQGAPQKRHQLAEQGIISQYAGQFTHAHNQYLDDLSKRGIIGLVAFLAIFVIPLRRFMPGLKSDSAETKLIATLGTLHVLAVMIYSLSQGFFTHNSGNLFYFFLTIVWYALLTTQQGNIKKMA